MRRIAPAALLALFLALGSGLSACGGDDDETTTVESPGVDQTSSAETETDANAETTASVSGPEGALKSTGVGEVSRGDSTTDVEELFGAPDGTQSGPGCELAPDSPGALAYTYDLGDGELILSFDAASGELGYYRNTSPSLETTLGDRVGDRFATLQQNWGSSLEPLPLGAGPTAKNGIWVVRDGPEDELLFDIRGGEIDGISGGHIEICE